MAQYKCKLCGYIYDEETGEPKKNIDAGTSFEDIPGFKCPNCGVGTNMFLKVD